MPNPSPKPGGYAWMLPFLTVTDVRKALDFYQAAFGFETAYANEDGGRIVHAEMKYQGQTALLLTLEGMHSKPVKAPGAGAELPVLFFVYIKNVAAAYENALRLGATGVHAPATVPWGERHAHIQDPFGYRWQLAEALESA